MLQRQHTESLCTLHPVSPVTSYIILVQDQDTDIGISTDKCTYFYSFICVYLAVCTFKILSIYFWLCWVFDAVHRLFPVLVNEGYSLVVMHRLLISVTSLVAGLGL